MNKSEIAEKENKVILFVTNGDGTVNCSWCDEVFNADDARPDDDLEPICPGCYADALKDEAEI